MKENFPTKKVLRGKTKISHPSSWKELILLTVQCDNVSAIIE